MSQAEYPVLRVAYLPLIDCAPLVAAQHLGLDHQHGLQLGRRARPFAGR